MQVQEENMTPLEDGSMIPVEEEEQWYLALEERRLQVQV